jgi:hypothetical protein
MYGKIACAPESPEEAAPAGKRLTILSVRRGDVMRGVRKRVLFFAERKSGMLELMDMLNAEVTEHVNAMRKTKSLQEKKERAELLLNLCKSMHFFLGTINVARDIIESTQDLDEEFDFDDDCEEEFEEEFEEPMLELHKPKKRRRGAKNTDDDDDDMPF